MKNIAEFYDAPDGTRVDPDDRPPCCFRCRANSELKGEFIILCCRAFCDTCFPIMVAVYEAEVKVCNFGIPFAYPSIRHRIARVPEEKLVKNLDGYTREEVG